MEDFVYLKLDRKPPERPSNLEQLGMVMKEAGTDFGPGTSYGLFVHLIIFIISSDSVIKN